MGNELRILILEDSAEDAELIAHELRRGGFSFGFRRVEAREDFIRGIEEMAPDLILSDYNLPLFDGMSALRIAGEKCPEVPFIFVSGAMGEETAVQSLKSGATDYLLKDRLTRLVPAVRRALHDVDERNRRKAAEEALRRSEEKYRHLVENINDVLYAVDENGIITYISPAVRRWIGVDPAEVIGQPFRNFIHPEDLPRLLGGYAKLASGQVEPGEYRVIPKPGQVLWVRTSTQALFDQGRLTGLQGTLTDITIRKNVEEERKGHIARLKRALEGTIHAMAMTVESRDPYTAGHQRRVAGLAEAIASHLGYPEESVEGIRMAAEIHDIGKIAVPAEILSKPVKLSPIERSLVMVHAQAGYEILDRIEFPWPIARIVRQHHERLDGSGYPEGISGDAILPEAKILAVADVVEAMASYRPYRPALGLPMALDEISQQAGQLYDRQVVEACLTLFNQKGFTLEG